MDYFKWYVIFLVSLGFIITTHQFPSGRKRPKLGAQENKPSSSHHRCPHVDTNASGTIKLNREIFALPKTAPTNARKIRLYCRTGYLLEAVNKKRVRGTTNTSSVFTWFELQSYGRSIIRLKHMETRRYLAINRKGRVLMQARLHEDSLLKTKHEQNDFHSFASHKFYARHRHDLFIGIKKNGFCKPPRHTFPGQTAVQFMILD